MKLRLVGKESGGGRGNKKNKWILEHKQYEQYPVFSRLSRLEMASRTNKTNDRASESKHRLKTLASAFKKKKIQVNIFSKEKKNYEKNNSLFSNEQNKKKQQQNANYKLFHC